MRSRVAHRCLFSLLPRSAASRDSIDLYGPSTIVFSLVVLLHYEFSAHGKVAPIACASEPSPTAGVSPEHVVCDGAHVLGARLPRAARVLLPQLHGALTPSDRCPHGPPAPSAASRAVRLTSGLLVGLRLLLCMYFGAGRLLRRLDHVQRGAVRALRTITGAHSPHPPSRVSVSLVCPTDLRVRSPPGAYVLWGEQQPSEGHVYGGRRVPRAVCAQLLSIVWTLHALMAGPRRPAPDGHSDAPLGATPGKRCCVDRPGRPFSVTTSDSARNVQH